MSRPNEKKIKNKIELYHILKWNCLIRQKGYRESYEKYIELIKNRLSIEKELATLSQTDPKRHTLLIKWNNITTDIASLLETCKTKSMPPPDVPISWRFIHYDKTVQRVRSDITGVARRFGEILFRLDYYQNVDILWYELKKKIEYVKKCPEIRLPYERLFESKKRKIKIPSPCISFERKGQDPLLKVFIYQKVKPLEKEFRALMRGVTLEEEYAPHPYVFERYFAVYDEMHKNEKLPYEQIVLRLKKKGWYGKKSSKQALDLVKKDYKKACLLMKLPDTKKPSKAKVKSFYSKKISGINETVIEDMQHWNKILRKLGFNETDEWKNVVKRDKTISEKINTETGEYEGIYNSIESHSLANHELIKKSQSDRALIRKMRGER